MYISMYEFGFKGLASKSTDLLNIYDYIRLRIANLYTNIIAYCHRCKTNELASQQCIGASGTLMFFSSKLQLQHFNTLRVQVVCKKYT